jgi:hypothetical protein
MSSAGPRARRGEDSDLMHSLRDRSIRLVGRRLRRGPVRTGPA